MQTPKEPIDDLEYLSQLGFEKVPVGGEEIRMLKRKVRSKFYPSANSLYVISVSLVAGALIGALIFYFIYSGTANESLHQSVNEKRVSAADPQPPAEKILSEIQLDTLTIIKENFQKPVRLKSRADTPAESVSSGQGKDTFQVIILDPANFSSVPSYSLTERKLKFMINSPVVYIHDLKVSDYTSLYFRKNQFIKSASNKSNPAEYASGNDNRGNGSGLKQEATYYLHEELADALMFFKKGKYDLSIVSLKKVAEYTKTDVNCDFYLGMSFYYKKNFSVAAGYFGAVIENPNNAFLQEAMYYKALALLGSGNKKEATVLLKKIVEESEFYSEKAKRLVTDN